MGLLHGLQAERSEASSCYESESTPLSLPLISLRLCLTCYNQPIKRDRDPFRHYGYKLLLVCVCVCVTVRPERAYIFSVLISCIFLCRYAVTIRKVPYHHSSRYFKKKKKLGQENPE